MPPPIHKLATPRFFPVRFNAYKSVTKTLAPLAPIGWPKAIAPPLIFTFASSTFNPLLTDNACAAKASFNSNKSTSSSFHPAFSKTFGTASIGPKIKTKS